MPLRHPAVSLRVPLGRRVVHSKERYCIWCHVGRDRLLWDIRALHLLVGLVTFLFSHHASGLGAGGGFPVCTASLLRQTSRSDISSIVGKAIQHGICGITEIYISRDRQHPGRAGLFRARHLPADICSIYWSEQRGYGGDGCSTKWCRCVWPHPHRHSG